MDKNAIKKFAVWARRELISRVSQRALLYGITADGSAESGADSVNGRVLTLREKEQREALLARVREKGYEEVMEEAAYTWFNRFSALRFMEVNGYLPSRVRVFTDEDNAFHPQLMAEALHLELDGLDREKVFEYKDANQTEELYKYLLITQCNALSPILPGMFERIADYTELLFPDNLLREGSVVERMVALIPEEDWRDAVQILGWLYQYYNAEKKDEVFAALKKNVKITKDNIPAATQLFTPDWIVRYMVENSLGRLWVEGHPDEALKANWRYYLEEAQQEPEVEAQLAELRKGYAALTPEDLRVIDPCCGSGHILAYMFDVLMQIYESYGYTPREAVACIVERNLYGLDIDDRAAQLAYFSVMMKARQYDRRFFSHVKQPRVYAICESNALDSGMAAYFCNGDAELTKAIATIREELYDAKEYGSILNVSQQNWKMLYDRFDEVQDEISMDREAVLNDLLPLVRVAQAMAQKYDVVCTNPPYMGASGMSGKLAERVKKDYPDSKADLFAVMIERCGRMTRVNGYQAMITQHAWMFLSSFEKLRVKILHKDLVNMAHLGPRAFEEIGGEVVQTTSFVLQNQNIRDRRGVYCRLVEPTTQQGKEDMFLAGENRYEADQSNFSQIPGSPVAYWVSDKILQIFQKQIIISDIGKSLQGTVTGDNNRFMRFWFEIEDYKFISNASSSSDVTGYKWIPYCKGGEFRRWYGNMVHVINWENDGYEIKNFKDMSGKLRSRPQNIDSFFKRSITWSSLTSGAYGARILNKGASFSDIGPIILLNNANKIYSTLGYLNTKVFQNILDICCSGLHYQNGVIAKLPCYTGSTQDEIIKKSVEYCVSLSCSDWDSFETSWDFQQHPLVKLREAMRFSVTDGDTQTTSYLLAGAYNAWKAECEGRFQTLKANEEELNRIFIDIYGLQDELTPEVEDKDVTVYRVFDTKEEIPERMGSSKYALTRRDVVVSFISYAVGCMLGRYSLDVEGLAFAGGEWDASKYRTFPADEDNIIPICDDEYFEDDIVGRFVQFVKTVYGAETLEENLRFIAGALGGRGQPREVIRSYFLNDFYKDHCKTYQKRPIYWLFDSGKKNGFKALIYMHRYRPDTIARIRTDYVHEQQSRYRTAIEEGERQLASAVGGERVRLTKALARLNDQDAELRIYEEKIHHLADQMLPIDLDDGVKHNYEMFKDVLAKIK